jgi:hypothetical protein
VECDIRKPFLSMIKCLLLELRVELRYGSADGNALAGNDYIDYEGKGSYGK